MSLGYRNVLNQPKILFHAMPSVEMNLLEISLINRHID